MRATTSCSVVSVYRRLLRYTHKERGFVVIFSEIALNELSTILKNSNVLGEFNLGSMKVEIYDLTTYEDTLIKV
jgi:hypothetical protein